MGTVNLGLLKILIAKSEAIKRSYACEFIIIGVADSSGIAVCPEGFEYKELIELKEQQGHVSGLKSYLSSVPAETIIDETNADLLIDGSPANLRTGEPGLSVVRKALTMGWSVVLANKAPLVFAFDQLHRLAGTNGGKLAFSATVCGGLPVINVLRRDLKFATLISLRGIFNATTNYILGELEKGGTMESAIREAQRLGAAEADPSHDVHGHDTANKLFIIMKSFTDYRGTIDDISVEGIQNLDAQSLEIALRKGNKIKLLAGAEAINGMWKLSVRPVEVPALSFLGTCDGWEMGLELRTDLYERIAMKNYEADPVGTSAAVLRDALALTAGENAVSC